MRLFEFLFYAVVGGPAFCPPNAFVPCVLFVLSLQSVPGLAFSPPPGPGEAGSHALEKHLRRRTPPGGSPALSPQAPPPHAYAVAEELSKIKGQVRGSVGSSHISTDGDILPCGKVGGLLRLQVFWKHQMAVGAALQCDSLTVDMDGHAIDETPTTFVYDMDAYRRGFRNGDETEGRELEGHVPPDLRGTYFRNGHARFKVGSVPASAFSEVSEERRRGERGAGKEKTLQDGKESGDEGEDLVLHPFDADGMVAAVTFDKGRAFFRSRFIRTKGFEEEEREGRVKYRGVFGTHKKGGWMQNIFDYRLKNVANTGVLWWNQKLFALWEQGLPHRIDPATLETLGECKAHALLKKGIPLAAHYVHDPKRDVLVAFSSKIGPLTSQVRVWEISKDMEVLSERKFSIKGVAFLHDFGVTDNHYLFVNAHLTLSPLKFLLGLRGIGETLEHDADKESTLYLLKRPEAGVREESGEKGREKKRDRLNRWARAVWRWAAGGRSETSDSSSPSLPLSVSSHGGEERPDCEKETQKEEKAVPVKLKFTAGDTKVKEMKLDNFFVFHFANAFEENGKLVFDIIRVKRYLFDSAFWEDPDEFLAKHPPPLRLKGSDEPLPHNFHQRREFVLDREKPIWDWEGVERRVPHATLWRYRVDPQTEEFEAVPLTRRFSEFPTINGRYKGRPYRYVYMLSGADPYVSAPLQGLVKVDLATNSSQTWFPAPWQFLGECQFVDRQQQQDASLFEEIGGGAEGKTRTPLPALEERDEDDGYLLSFMFDGRKNSSSLVIFDARDITRGPISSLPLKAAVPHGLHGTFVPSADVSLLSEISAAAQKGSLGKGGRGTWGLGRGREEATSLPSLVEGEGVGGEGKGEEGDFPPR
uniref:Uncharacterized protein n=1 Tax=Chromera velia CCMP2878 TaxID=1169474 RepID=A0A0G4FU10_9ALVE|eukprot:Cvel_3731.t1-p1 / transcript=Cvel_3731.t1 / gene=Cvel_3731 / organism=Chromera_velia_CCMP2878 / gene_product=Apocarotenoid-15,15'-oxygenase, putative / transcript_product=Apocarotenoid-15,15'-oxygenase, putative / location=Cvel_scaffold155:59991-65223(-) / protein_length=870 / sequence_SO=supercontig / SO=protein_coding / is_pseudo=false